MRPKSKTPRGVLQVDWPFFGELCRVLALKVFREYDPQVVIGIAKAGVIPGAVVASILQRDFASIAITKEGSVIAGANAGDGRVDWPARRPGRRTTAALGRSGTCSQIAWKISDAVQSLSR